MDYLPVYELTRGPVVESVHHGAAAVADAQGRLLAWWANPQVVTFLRSSAKPFQAIPLVESGAADYFGLTPEEIALICGSHDGTDAHVARAASIQRKAGFSESDLLCGVHAPLDKETAARLAAEGQEPTPNRHNCSGKHSGMLALASFLGEPFGDYVEPQHAVQARLLKTFAAMCALPPEQVAIGIDGCSVPTYAVPLASAAAGYARLTDPSGLEPGRADACRRIVAAMTQHPFFVGGEQRFDTRLMQVCQGRVVSKAGAEGYHGVAVLPGARGPDSAALGVAVKIADGEVGRKVGGAVVLHILQALGVIGAGEREALAEFGPRPITNYRRITVGEGRLPFSLTWVAGEDD
jgi:L-asparaginase II